MAAQDADLSERILIYTPFGKDAQHLCKTLIPEGFECVSCKDVSELIHEISMGVAGILTTEEVLLSKDAKILRDHLANQPSWSAIPIVLFFTARDAEYAIGPYLAKLMSEMTDITLLARPVSSWTLLNVLKSAVRDRRRQYQTKGLLEKLQEEVKFRAKNEMELSKAKQSAESANLSKSQFLANMSHEIRTPLGIIMGYSELISQAGTLPEERDTYISVILRNSHQLLRIIDDILDLSKVEAGKMNFEALPMSVPIFLKDIADAFDLRARENGNQFRLIKEEPLPEFILTDPTRLRQILTNVIGNAIKFTQSGLIEITVRFKEGLLSFAVRDTGRGITPDQARMLFQPFTQADTATNRKYGGTGLGLVLTKRLCAAMGGDFVLKESELGRGSTFVASVKVGDEVRRRVETPLVQKQSEVGKGPLSGRRILLVEDSPDNQTLIRIVLTRAGAQVDIASDGMEGIEKFSQADYSAILMDVQMPRMGGVEAVGALRAKGATLPIIALTAHAMKEEQKRCLDAGYSHFLTKPINKTKLVELLQGLRS